MAFTEKDVEKLAALARIELTPEEKKKFSGQISSILDYVKQVQEVDTSKVKETSHLKDLANAFRKDEKAGNLNKTKAVLE